MNPLITAGNIYIVESEQNIKTVADAGVDCVGVASAIFSSPDPIKALTELYENV